jgi:hypothetical protein
MCIDCEAERFRPLKPVAEREVPQRSGEAAIYSPELLARREGNALGTRPEAWRSNLFG